MLASALYSLLFVAVSLAAAFLVAGVSAAVAGERVERRYVVFGMGIFFVGIALHSLIALPVVLVAQGPLAILGPGRGAASEFEAWHLIYFALAAGVGQEAAKVIPLVLESRRPGSRVGSRSLGWLGLLVGLGFSASEIILVATSSWQPIMEGLGVRNVLLGGLERTSASLFHMGTAAWLGASLSRHRLPTALAGCMALHAALDAVAGSLKVSTPSGIVIEQVALFLFSSAFFLLVFRASVLAVCAPSASEPGELPVRSSSKNTQGYYWFIYWNPDDKRIFVPKRLGFGWTINFANPVAVAVLIAIIVGMSLLGNILE